MNEESFISFFNDITMRHNIFFHNPKRLVVCFLLAFLQGLLFIGLQVSSTGALSFPLDDSYIHLQYARQIANGAYFQYQDGDPVTSGATSFLYVHILALGYVIGFRGELFLVWPVLIAWISFAASLYFLVQIGENLGSLFAGWATVWLVLVSGLIAWGMWSGMEIALFTAILLWTLSELCRSQRIHGRLFPALAMLALCRPEGMIIAVCIFFLFLIQQGKEGSNLMVWKPLRNRLYLLFFFLAILVPPLFYRINTGKWSSNGLLAKSLLHHPLLSSSEIMSQFTHNLVSLVAFLMGFMEGTSIEFVLPGMLVFSMVGLIRLFLSNRLRIKGYAFCVSACLVLVLLAIATLEVWPLHNFRYVLPFFPFFLFLAVLGGEACFSLLNPKDQVGRIVPVAVGVLLSTIYLPAWAARFAENASTIYEKQRRASLWMADSANLYDDAQIAVNDAGAIVFFGEGKNPHHHYTDLVGLVTNGPAVAYRMGEGGLYEWMQHISPEQRPQFAAVFPSWFLEMSHIYDLFYHPLVTFPDPFEPSFGKTIFQVNWSYSGIEVNPRKKTMQPGWIVKDRLDIADLASEQEHQYSFVNRSGHFPDTPVPFRRNFGYHEEIEERWPDIENEVENLIPLLKEQGILNHYDILDAGRRIDGEERFSFHHLQPGTEAFLIMRTCDASGLYPIFTYRAEVFIHGLYVGMIESKGTPWNWYEIVLPIPADLIREPQIDLRIVNTGSSRFSYYDSFFYWICQASK